MLEAFLDHYRAIVVSKTEGISDDDARKRLVRSLTTVGGLVRHLRWVEVGWFHQVLGDQSGEHRRPHDRRSEFLPASGETVEHLVDDYRRACEQSRVIASAHGLDDTVPHRKMGRVSARWIYVHLLEETARHAGHLDILREQLDGTTGFT